MKPPVGMVGGSQHVTGACGGEVPGRATLRLFIAGFQYHDGPAVRMGLSIGELLLLRPEPENRHDRGAIAVFRLDGRTKLGYVPREFNRRINQLIEYGAKLSVRLCRVDYRGQPGYGTCRFEMTVTPIHRKPTSGKWCRRLLCRAINRPQARYCRRCGLAFAGTSAFDTERLKRDGLPKRMAPMAFQKAVPWWRRLSRWLVGHNRVRGL